MLTESAALVEPATLTAEAVVNVASPPQPGVGHDGSVLAPIANSEDRGERLVRQLGVQIDELRATIDGGSLPGSLTRLDLVAVVANPDAAANLPSALLVRALLDAHKEVSDLERRLTDQRTQIEALSERLRGIETEHAFTRGRMQTFDDVIAATQANLEDLRFQRDGARQLPPASAPRTLRSGDPASPGAARPAEDM